MDWIGAALGIVASGMGVWLWYLNHTAPTKKERKDQNAAEVHKRTSDIIDDELR